MDSEGEEIADLSEALNQDQDESEDYSTFFLQPASCPYNIAQKVEEANNALYNSSLKSEKSPKVRFREDLVSFDAQLTDDDVVSIESDHGELPFMEQQRIDQTIVFEYKTNSANMFSIDEVGEDEIIEDIECELEGIKKLDSNEEIAELETAKTEIPTQVDKQLPRENESPDSSSEESKQKPKSKRKSPKTINCKYHCIERIETELSDAIRKLSLNEKPAVCPPLKLIDRKCCTKNHRRNPTVLPKYEGLYSEYGLSVEQIARRQKIKGMIRSREEKRQELMKEYKRKREEVNEQVFCDWLKRISERKHRIGFKEYRESLNRVNGASNQIRPVSSSKVSSRGIGSSKTTSESGYSSEKSGRARSGGSSQSVYVEVPRNVLQRGMSVENLLNNIGHPKQLYITTIS